MLLVNLLMYVTRVAQFFSFVKHLLDSSLKRPFGPVIEAPNPTAFLTTDPVQLWENGEFNDVPLMLGKGKK